MNYFGEAGISKWFVMNAVRTADFTFQTGGQNVLDLFETIFT